MGKTEGADVIDLHQRASQNTLIGDIPDDMQAKRGWSISLNGGKPIPKVTSLVLFNERMGVMFKYGLHPSGLWDQFAIHEPGGGGSITAPYTIIDGKLFIAVLREDRPFQGGMIENVPRGFLDPGKDHFQIALLELEEEARLELHERVHKLPGHGVNSNSAFFVNATPGEGCQFFAFYISPEELRMVDSRFMFKPDMLQPKTPLAEKITRSYFIHWKEAMLLGDMFTLAVVGKLVQELETRGICSISFRS